MKLTGLSDLPDLDLNEADKKEFADISKRLREKYPEGYTVVAQWGKTRTLYSFYNYLSQLEKGDLPEDFDPGKITDPMAYSATLGKFYIKHWMILKELGVSDIVVTLFHYEAWRSRGEEYTLAMLKMLENFFSDFMMSFYNKGFTPYFIGIDQILHFYNKEDRIYQLALELIEFQKNFKHKEGNVYFGAELFPVNSYTTSRQVAKMVKDGSWDKFEEEMKNTKDPFELENLLYEKRIQELCNGRILPKDSCIIGTSYNGDMHIRSTLSAEFLYHKRCRLFFYQGPSLLMGKEVYKSIFEDILTDKAAMRSKSFDHSGQHSLQYFEDELTRSINLTNEPDAVWGMFRKVK